MALTVAVDTNPQLVGSTWKMTGTIDFDAAYPVGGEALSAANVGLSVIDDIQFGSGRHGYVYYTDTALPATSVNVEILCPSGGAAPTSVAAPTLAATGIMTASGADSTALVDHTHPGSAITGGRGIEMGAADASSLTLIRWTAFGV